MQPALPEPTKQPQLDIEGILNLSVNKDNLQKLQGSFILYDEIDSKPSSVKQVLSTIHECVASASQKVYIGDLKTYDDEILVIRADLFLEFLKQEIEKLDE